MYKKDKMDLAILGSQPKFKEPLYITRPYLPRPEKLSALLGGLDKSRILTNNGYFAQRLEAKISRALEIKYAVLVSSATMGLQLLVRALGLKGEVIVPSFTFIASAHSLYWEGLKPVFIDIEPDYFTLDPDMLEKCITRNTSAVMPVHLFGNPCAIAEIEKFCQKRNLRLIFDAAQAMGSFYRDRPVGSFGTAEVFSLHATKIINTLEGGVITTNSYKLYQKLLLMRNFGFSGYDKVECLGVNAKMDEFSAGVGLFSISELQKNVGLNRQNHLIYGNYLKDIPGIIVPGVRQGCRSNYHGYPILVNDEFGVARDQLCDILWKENIIARRYYYPACHRMLPYRELFRDYKERLPVTERIASSILCLPCYPGMEADKIDKVAQAVISASKRQKEILRYYRSHKMDSRLISANKLV